MKNALRTLPGKILCFILCILMLGITMASVLGAVVMIDMGFYTTPESRMVEDAMYELIYSEANNILITAHSVRYQQDYSLSADNTNLRYQIVDSEGQVVKTNLTAPVGSTAGLWEYAFHEVRNDGFHETQAQSPQDGPAAEGYTLYVYLEDGLPADDKYALCSDLIHAAYALRYRIYVIAIVSLILSATCFVILMATAARKPHSEELHPGLLHRVPFDLLLFGVFTLLLLTLVIIMENYFWDEPVQIAFTLLWILSGACAGLGLCVSFAARIKAGTLLKNTLVWRVCRLLLRLLKGAGRAVRSIWKKALLLVRGLPMIWRTALLAAGLTFVDFLILVAAFDGSISFAVVLWLCKTLALAGAALYTALFMRKLQQGGRALAQGDLHYQIDTSMMFWDFKQHGENLNSIAGGMTAAVEQRLRSERMKTELITNVSHDIKTPLTSIINYATLIGETPCDCEKHAEYSEVLVRKSEHLRRLLDDLVEVSKATTGNLEVELAPCNAGVLLSQAVGEFEQRCDAAGLELVTAQPEEPLMIMADSRRIWRVFENLMVNACKYSLPGSRVFLRLEKDGKDAVFTFRNTASTVLDISPETLMERFVRGDTARSTEGSGLGLPIAQSLTQLQKGQMDISIDGDIFKVTLRFPLL